MTANLPQAQRGCLLIADISGYTDYLKGSELEHAQDVLADLLETIIAGIEPPFEVSKLEGDAVFAHMPVTDVDTSRLFDTIESTYFSFRRRLRDVVHGTTCNCDACILIPSLDLKFVVHAGSYVVRTIGRTEELTGSDVILVHRLLKGTARDVVGDSAYLVLTEAALAEVGGDAEELGLIRHVEQLDVGATTTYIENLTDRWDQEAERLRQVVTPETEHGSFLDEYQATRQELWEWYTEPRRRLEWQEGLTSIDESVQGRRGIGSVNHCAHGGGITIQHVLDWQPFSQFTTRDELEGVGVAILLTYEFATDGETTSVTTRVQCHPPEAFPQMKAMFEPALERSAETLRGIMGDQSSA